MLPPGMSFNAISDKAIAAAKTAKLPKSFFAGTRCDREQGRLLPLHPGTNLLTASRPPSTCCTRKASTTCSPATSGSPKRPGARCAWGLEIIDPEVKQYSPTITAVMTPEGDDAEAFRALALETFNIAYGASFGRVTAK